MFEISRQTWVTIAGLVFWIAFAVYWIRLVPRRRGAPIGLIIICLMGIGFVLWITWIYERLTRYPLLPR